MDEEEDDSDFEVDESVQLGAKPASSRTLSFNHGETGVLDAEAEIEEEKTSAGERVSIPDPEKDYTAWLRFKFYPYGLIEAVAGKNSFRLFF